MDENNLRLTCEAVIASGSGAGFTAEQLVTLSRDDIRDCLYELGSRPLSWDKSALLWNKVIEVIEIIFCLERFKTLYCLIFMF